MSSAVSLQCSNANDGLSSNLTPEFFIGSVCDAVSEVIDVIVQSLRDVLKRQPSEGLLWDNYGKLCLLIDEIVNEVGLKCFKITALRHSGLRPSSKHAQVKHCCVISDAYLRLLPLRSFNGRPLLMALPLPPWVRDGIICMQYAPKEHCKMAVSLLALLRADVWLEGCMSILPGLAHMAFRHRTCLCFFSLAVFLSIPGSTFQQRLLFC